MLFPRAPCYGNLNFSSFTAAQFRAGLSTILHLRSLQGGKCRQGIQSLVAQVDNLQALGVVETAFYQVGAPPHLEIGFPYTCKSDSRNTFRYKTLRHHARVRDRDRWGLHLDKVGHRWTHAPRLVPSKIALNL